MEDHRTSLVFDVPKTRIVVGLLLSFLCAFEVDEFLVPGKEVAACLRELKLGLPEPTLNIIGFLLG